VALTARQRTRYARHLLLPEIGLAGQERLLSARVTLPAHADARVARAARVYLERAGVQVDLAGAAETALADRASVEQMAGSTALEPAAAALAGALGAVEAIKEVLQLGHKGDAPWAQVRLVPEDV